ncbi:unnamed protein product [Ectocarpus sp. 6 AP-2014]
MYPLGMCLILHVMEYRAPKLSSAQLLTGVRGWEVWIALVGIHAWWDPPDPRPSRALPSVQIGTHCVPRVGRLLLTVCVVASSVLLEAAKSSPTQSASASTIGAASAPASTAARTGVLIHGCHLGAKRWRSIMWGDEQQQRLGRLPHGARLAWEESACVVVLGTGASERDGVLEGRYALEYLKDNWEELGEFREAFSGVDLEQMRTAVQPLLVAEVRSQNTRQELLEAGCIFREKNCNRIILVSSPTHLPRCLRDACSLWLDNNDHHTPASAALDSTIGKPGSEKGHEEEEEENLARMVNGEAEPQELPTRRAKFLGNQGGSFDDTMPAKHDDFVRGDIDDQGEARRQHHQRQWRPLILASPSSTSYANYSPADVAIVEPPHRGDSSHHVAEENRGNIAPEIPESGEPPAAASNGRRGDFGGARSVPAPEDHVPLMLHELAAMVLRVKPGSDKRFRLEFEALLRQYVEN